MGIGNEIVRQDWINRFFGYLGSMQYVHEKAKSATHAKYRKSPGAENILYIYSAETMGMYSYQKMIEQEVESIAGGRYKICKYDFLASGAKVGGTKDSLDFQIDFKKTFEKAEGFEFPCMDLLEKLQKDPQMSELNVWKSVAGEFFMEAPPLAESLLTGSYTSALFGGINLGKNIIEMILEQRQAVNDRKSEIYTKLRSECNKIFETTGQLEKCLEENTFFYLSEEMKLNALKTKDKKCICIMSGFERCYSRLGEQEEENFLKMLEQAGDIIWILFSDRKPNELERRFVKSEYVWRMAGINKTWTIEYLKSQCPNLGEDWYEKVYEYTGGYVGLVDLCVAAQQDSKRQYDEKQINTFHYLVKELGKNEQEVRAMLQYENKSQNPFEDWIREVWNYKPNDWSRTAIEIFLTEEMQRYKDAYLLDNEEESKLLGGLYYLAELSKVNIGTLAQFSWSRNIDSKGYEFTEINKEGVRILRKIATLRPFCIEYTEYPDMVHLDPVIIRVLLMSNEYDNWKDWFKEKFKCKEMNINKLEYMTEVKEKKWETHIDNEVETDVLQNKNTEAQNSDSINENMVEVIVVPKSINGIDSKKKQGEQVKKTVSRNKSSKPEQMNNRTIKGTGHVMLHDETVKKSDSNTSALKFKAAVLSAIKPQNSEKLKKHNDLLKPKRV